MIKSWWWTLWSSFFVSIRLLFGDFILERSIYLPPGNCGPAAMFCCNDENFIRYDYDRIHTLCYNLSVTSFPSLLEKLYKNIHLSTQSASLTAIFTFKSTLDPHPESETTYFNSLLFQTQNLMKYYRSKLIPTCPSPSAYGILNLGENSSSAWKDSHKLLLLLTDRYPFLWPFRGDPPGAWFQRQV